AHFLANERPSRRRPLRQRLALAVEVDGNGCLVAMRNGPDDVFRSPGRVAAKEYTRPGRHHGHPVDLGHVPLAELDPDVPLNPGEGVLLPDRHQHVVAGNDDFLAGGDQLAPTVSVLGSHDLEPYACEPAILDDELFGIMIVEDWNALALCVLDLPFRRLHILARRADGYRHLLGTEAQSRPAAVHGGVAATDHQDAATYTLYVLEGDRGQELDADVNIGGAFLAARDVEILPLRGACADKHCVEALVENGLEARHLVTEARLDAEIEDAVHFLVEHVRGQAECGNVRAHEPAALLILFEQHAVVPERHQIAGNGQ